MYHVTPAALRVGPIMRVARSKKADLSRARLCKRCCSHDSESVAHELEKIVSELQVKHSSIPKLPLQKLRPVNTRDDALRALFDRMRRFHGTRCVLLSIRKF